MLHRRSRKEEVAMASVVASMRVDNAAWNHREEDEGLWPVGQAHPVVEERTSAVRSD